MQLFISESRIGTLSAMEKLLERKKEGLVRLERIKQALDKQQEQMNSQYGLIKRNLKQADDAQAQAALDVVRFSKVVDQLKKRQKEMAAKKFKNNFQGQNLKPIEIV